MNTLLELARPKTLPLAFAVILIGNALALWHGGARLSVFLLELATALALQIVSNVANDYGDGLRGTDTHRQGPRRILASGLMSPAQIRTILICCALASLLLGAILLAVSHRSFAETATFLTLGLLALTAALTYTLGRYAYGYYALGEVAVFLFFGLLGVAGSYYLQTAPLPACIWLPASGAGLLAAAVLHINNLRDLDSDQRAGRQTIAIHLGFPRARRFHILLLCAGLACYLIFALIYAWQSALWLLLTPWIHAHAQRIRHLPRTQTAGNELKTIVLINFGVALLFAIGLCLNKKFS